MKEIKQLIKILPKKDYDIAVKLLDKRNFSELSMLIQSDIVKVERVLNRVNAIQPKYTEKLEKLVYLKARVDEFNMDYWYGED